MLVILQKNILVGLSQMGFCCIRSGDVRFIVIDYFPFETVVVYLGGFPVELAVEPGETRNTVFSLIKFALRAEPELVCICLQLRDIRDAVFIAGFAADEQALAM